MLTDLVWILICIQIVMGASDTLIHHEFLERLAWRPSQELELRLHGARNLFYALIFLALGFTDFSGLFATVLLVALYAELVITLWDFVEEDRTRKLPPTERVLHTLMALNYGAILMGATPLLLAAAALPTAAAFALHGFWTLPCAVAALGVIVFGARDLAAARRMPRLAARSPASLLRTGPRRRVLVTGGTGFIGARLVAALVARGDDITVLTRNTASAARLATPVRIVTSLDQLPDDTRIDAIVNLAGQSVAGGLWTARYRRRVLRSRLRVTRNVMRLIARLHTRPAVLVSGSAIGVYGADAEGVQYESTALVADGSFAQRLCQDWERSALAAEAQGVRTILLRIGLVLDSAGGSLAQMLPAFEFGAGGPFGRGLNWMSWISRDDLVRLIDHAIDDKDLRGPLNGVAPQPALNRDFARALGAALHRPAILALPTPLLVLALGDLAREIFLGSQHVRPNRALQSGFRYLDPDIGDLLKRLTGARDAPATPAALASVTPAALNS